MSISVGCAFPKHGASQRTVIASIFVAIYFIYSHLYVSYTENLFQVPSNSKALCMDRIVIKYHGLCIFTATSVLYISGLPLTMTTRQQLLALMSGTLCQEMRKKTCSH